MAKISYKWTSDAGEHALDLIRVEGTKGRPYPFGEGTQTLVVEVPEFWLATVTVTQALWQHVMGDDPAVGRERRQPSSSVESSFAPTPVGA
jgi:formylglycine-generating enzyme required for sulfatase activity